MATFWLLEATVGVSGNGVEFVMPKVIKNDSIWAPFWPPPDFRLASRPKSVFFLVFVLTLAGTLRIF